MSEEKTVLIVGASRGLGLALAEEFCAGNHRVVATVRSPSAALEKLAKRFTGRLAIEEVDIADADSVTALRSRLDGEVLDILFVNAGICLARESTPLDVEVRDFVDLMVTNALSPMRLVEAFESLVPANGIIAVMTSELASIHNNTGLWEIYSSSKAALNMLMKCFAARHRVDSRSLLLIAPGWVRTEMGGPRATYSVEESIPHVVQAVQRSWGRPGLRFIDRHGRTIPW
jgi:NAD(P)-dependent dehydrogenase (short-subunit alcohol dehydrogenase family)